MTKVLFSSNYGNFDYEMEVELPEAVGEPTITLVKEGLANIAYRVCGSAVDKVLGVDKDKGAFKTRRDVPFSIEAADKINGEVDKKLKALKFEYIGFTVNGEHAYGDGASPMARATLLVDTMIAGGQEVALRAILMAEDGTDRDGLIKLAHSKGLGIQLPKAKK